MHVQNVQITLYGYLKSLLFLERDVFCMPNIFLSIRLRGNVDIVDIVDTKIEEFGTLESNFRFRCIKTLLLPASKIPILSMLFKFYKKYVLSVNDMLINDY